MSTLADIPKAAWNAYRALRERVEATRGTAGNFDAISDKWRWEMEAAQLHGMPTFDDLADLLARVSDSEWAEGQIRHLQHTVDELRRERDSLLSRLAQAQTAPCGGSGP